MVPYDLKPYIGLKASFLSNKMPGNILTQYTVVNVSMQTDESNKMFKAEIVLRRMPMYHLTKTYVPTFTLLVIVELTLFFDESHLQVSKLFNIYSGSHLGQRETYHNN
jgi:hypothetical protein